MKIIAYLLAIVALGIVSCDDEEQTEPSFVSANLNEEPWSGLPEISIDAAHDTLTFLGIGNEQVIVFKIKFIGVDVYNLSEHQALYYTTVGGDAITSQYLLNTHTPSQVIITAYDDEQNTLEGSFTISLSQKWSNPESPTDILRFTNGLFKGAISK